MNEDVDEHFRLWLRAGMTGCEFAKRLSGKAHRITTGVHVDVAPPPTDWLNSLFEISGEMGRAAVAVFPQVTDENALASLLNSIERERWRVLRRKRTTQSDNILIGIEWLTSNGDRSEVMGFAPFPTMPVTRRAPYVAIATWPGDHLNPLRGKGSTPLARPGVVSFLDAPSDLSEELYEKHWQETSARVTGLMEVPPDDAKIYRNAAFALYPEATERLIFDN